MHASPTADACSNASRHSLRRCRRLIDILLTAALGILSFHAPRVQGDNDPQQHTAAGAPLTPAETPDRMRLPAGFKATLFAGEPDVVQPIAFTFDDRGRLWVVECLSYPDWDRGAGSDRLQPVEGDDIRGRLKPATTSTSTNANSRDRVLIFEDTDGDGRFDERTVFYDRGRNLTGIELGFGGVWLCSTPNLIFVPDRDGDDMPDTEPEIVLDGWSLEAKHNVFNGLTWGPDGWLYGCNGILDTSLVGPPGTPDDERVPMDCGVWRIHPVTRAFEPVAWGTTNPWGLDFDQHGRIFITNCVIKHLFHFVPGGHYERMYGQDLNPHVYQLMQSCADHIHWAGGDWQSSRGGVGAHDTAGGGHAHAGCMIYLGDNWPEPYRGRLFTCNIHGNRINQDVLKPHGSGYVASHEPDFLRVPDTWFRGLELAYGPDGGVYLTDWSDTGECHDYEDIHRENGRIYKITYGDITPVRLNLQQLSDAELLALLIHENEWQARQARRILHERAAAGTLSDSEDLSQQLRALEDRAGNRTALRLRLLWTRHAMGLLDDATMAALCRDDDELLRAWAVRLELDDRRADPDVLERFADMATNDTSPVVRLFLASALQRLKPEQRWPIATGLLTHAEDADDPNLPLMIWYGVEPLVPIEPDRAADMLALAEIPLVRQLVARRIAALEGRLDALVRMLAHIDDPGDEPTRRDVLAGMHGELNGRRNVPMPAGWAELAPELRTSRDTEVRQLALRLSLIFGDPQALAELRRLAADSQARTEERRHALDALAQVHSPEVLKLLKVLLSEPSLRAAAIRGLASYEDPQIPERLLAMYPRLNSGDRQDAIGTLASRPAFALALLDAVESGQVDRRDVSAFTVRQLASLGDQRVTERLQAVWGEVRPTGKEKAEIIARLKEQLTDDALADADPSRGRAVFSQTCAACHELFGEGRKVGPDLTGSQRTNLDYILENAIDPSAVVGRDHRMTTVITRAGRVINGLVTQETAKTLTLDTATERVVLAKADIDERHESNLSMMPEGILEKLTDEELRNLIAYLASPVQVPLPDPEPSAGANSAK